MSQSSTGLCMAVLCFVLSSALTAPAVRDTQREKNTVPFGKQWKPTFTEAFSLGVQSFIHFSTGSTE